MKRKNEVSIWEKARRCVASLLGAVSVMLPAVMASGQTSVLPSVSFPTADTSVCDIDGTINAKVLMRNIPSNATSIMVYVRLIGGTSIEGYGGYLANYRNNEIPLRLTNRLFHHNNETGHAEFTFEITRAYVTSSTSAQDQQELTIGSPSRMTWHLYGTPSTDATLVSSTDPSCIKIMNDSRACGYDMTLQANSAWSDVSTYTWAVSGDNFTVGSEGTTSELKQIRFSDGKGASQALSTTVTLTQTVGGVCTAQTSKTITMMGAPEATISLPEESETDHVTICTSLDEDDDPSRYFSGVLTIEGEAPYSATLSTGDSYTGLVSGVNKFSDAHAVSAGRVTISSIIDANGCEASESLKHGYITVVDRKPTPIFRNDTINVESRDISLECEPTSMAHNFEWGVMPQHEGLDTKISGNTYTADATSNMNSQIGYYVIETDDDNGTSCSSDTTVVTVNYSMPLRYPNGFSPNGDGRNDYLVIEGLPERNKIMVVDSRGKTVFEAQDYRNNWQAEGIDDGYYVYIFKGEGTKTVKETLVIKRTTK